ncbi:hypothetical protein WISP_80576 [Willisornis vidua]|uniref:Uncharacterized protein n=1 Tax=Willisornis vidua TaxID=1566151 RepID=A0ABQ9D563_9PASS|nr:hypothetical protein WISP_80576 [Willisornis vidua]
MASPLLSTGNGHSPSPAGHTISDSSQDVIGLLGHLGTLLGHSQLLVASTTRFFSLGNFLDTWPRLVVPHGVLVTQVQDPVFGLVKPHTIGLSPWIQPVQILLYFLPILQQSNTSTQLGVIFKLTENALNPHIELISVDPESLQAKDIDGIFLITSYGPYTI